MKLRIENVELAFTHLEKNGTLEEGWAIYIQYKNGDRILQSTIFNTEEKFLNQNLKKVKEKLVANYNNINFNQ